MEQGHTNKDLAQVLKDSMYKDFIFNSIFKDKSIDQVWDETTDKAISRLLVPYENKYYIDYNDIFGEDNEDENVQ